MAFFSTTALGPGSPVFRGRQAELAHLVRLCRDEVTRYGVVYGGRQNGKTSLLFQLLAAVQHPVRICRVDFQQIQGAPPERVFALLAEQIDTVLPLGGDLATITGAPRLKARLSEALARSEGGRLVLLLDELGALPAASREALGNALRSFFHDRLVAPPLQKLQVIFSGGVELYTMVVSEVSSLHSVCAELYLPDLPEVAAVSLLADGLQAAGVDAALAAALGRAVFAQVAGHPYLTQRLGELLLDYYAAGAALDLAAVERATAELVAEAPPLLRRIRDDLRDYQLEEAARRLLRDRPRFDRLDDELVRLELIGLAKRDGAHWAPRNPLLAAVFRERLGLPAPAPQVQAEPPIAPTASTAKPAPLLSSPVPAAPAKPPPAPSAEAHKRPPAPASRSGEKGVRATLPPWTPELVHVPAGTFLMGSSNADPLARSNEKPQHPLELPDYWIGKTPVTNAQFRPFVEGGGYRNHAYWTTVGWKWLSARNFATPSLWSDSWWNGDDYPVVGISWFEAVAYCRWLSVKVGITLRLPTEAEWEKAARGPYRYIWPWGDTWEDGRCNSAKGGLALLGRIFGQTTPVHKYPGGASPYGALDMAGNVWEWCATHSFKGYPYQLEDEWAEAYLKHAATLESVPDTVLVEGEWQETYIEDNKHQMVRGGCFVKTRTEARGAYRGSFDPRSRVSSVGLRVASDAPLPGASQ